VVSTCQYFFLMGSSKLTRDSKQRLSESSSVALRLRGIFIAESRRVYLPMRAVERSTKHRVRRSGKGRRD